MQLLIVESPAKAKKIQAILHKLGHGDFRVVACCGHVRDLEKKNLSIDIEKEFRPKFVPIPGKMDDIAKLCRKSNHVWLGSDNDMEGEAISWHLQQMLSLKENYKRVTFNEITERALRAAINRPKKINMQMVEAQLARRVLDRLVGFKLSPVLWDNFSVPGQRGGGGGAGLSAGRVQSAALKIICDQEKKIQTHESEPYWTLAADLVVIDIPLEGKLYDNGVICKLESKTEAKRVLGSLTLRPKVSKMACKTAHEAPPAPFTTSTLQQEASKQGSGVQQTMRNAQALYEHGLITYMRTDCCMIAQDALDEIGAHVRETFGAENHKRRTWEHKKAKGAQEAHEAIRPTDITVTQPHFEGITVAHKKLYQIIWKRTVASQMIDAEYAEGIVHVIDAGFEKPKTSKEFVGKLRVLVRPGWHLVYGVDVDQARLKQIKKLQKASNISVKYGTHVRAHNTWTHPPQRHNESGLVKVLESEGIGRPSTYAAIIDKLLTKNYMVKQNHKGVEHNAEDYVLDVVKRKVTKESKVVVVGAEQNKLTPTTVGTAVNAFLEQHFDYIVDKAFTATLELELDEIAEGERTRLDLLTEFWRKFSKRLAPWEKKKQEGKKERQVIERDPGHEIRDSKGRTWIAREARFGPVLQHDKTFINLKVYLAEKKMGLTDMTGADADVLTQFPIKRKGGVSITLGPYGAYLKKGEENYKIAPWVYKKYGVAKIHEMTDEEIQDALANQKPKADGKKSKGHKKVTK